MVETIFYTILTISTMFILGYGITMLVLPKKLFPHAFWLTPWIFIIFIINFLVISSLLGLPTKISAPIIGTLLIFLSVYIFFKTKHRIKITIVDIFLLLMVFLNIIFNIIPILRREGILTTLTYGSGDIVSYASDADYLVKHSIIEGFHSPLLPSDTTLIRDGYRWGPSILTAFFLSLFHLSGYQLAYLMEVILFSLAMPLLYVLLKILYKPTFSGMILTFILTAFNTNLLYILYNNFFGQVLFWGIEIMFFILFSSYFESDEEKKSGITIYDVMIALAISGLYFSYHEPSIFIFAPLILYLLLRFIFKLRPFSYLRKLTLIGAIAFSISSVSMFNAIVAEVAQTFASNPDQPIGWEYIRYANPFESMGFYNIHLFPPLPTYLGIILSIPVLIIIIWGIIKSRNKNLVISFTIIFVFFYYWTGSYNSNFFAYFRALSYTLPFFIVLFVVGFLEFVKIPILRVVLVTLMCGLVLFSALKINKKFRTIYLAVDKSLVSLKEIPLQNIEEPIYTENFLGVMVPYWITDWSSYFLYDNSFTNWPTKFNTATSLNKVPENSLVLSGKYYRWYSPPKIVLKDIIWENEYYRIGRLCNTNKCLADLDLGDYLSTLTIGQNDWEHALFLDGWSNTQGGERWSNSLKSTLRLVKKTPPGTISIEAKTINNPQKMNLSVNGVEIGTVDLSQEWSEYTFPLNLNIDNEGIYLIQFSFTNLYYPEKSELYKDDKPLSAGFKKIS